MDMGAGVGVTTLRSATEMEDIDLILVGRCKRNDSGAFEILVHRHKNRLYNFVYRMINNAEDAEDVTQEVFLRAFTRLQLFRGECVFQTWLYRIATNLCVDRSRKIKRQGPTPLSLDEPRDDEGEGNVREIPDERSDPFHELARQELRRNVQQGLARMSPKLRSVVVLYDIQGLSYEEIAQVLRIPVGTVKSRLFNARAELARKLKPYVVDGQ